MSAKSEAVDRFLEFVKLSMEPLMQRSLNYIIFKYDSASFEDYAKAHPPGSQNFEDWMRVAAFYDFLGAMVAREMVDADLAFKTFPIPWLKMRPVALGMREALRWPDMWEHFESLDQMERSAREARGNRAAARNERKSKRR